MSAHAPGWTLTATVHKGRYNLFALEGSAPYHVGTFISGSAKHKDRFERDARLIAAAPDLLEIAQLVVGSLSITDEPLNREIHRRARLAIQAATGDE